MEDFIAGGHPGDCTEDVMVVDRLVYDVCDVRHNWNGEGRELFYRDILEADAEVVAAVELERKVA